MFRKILDQFERDDHLGRAAKLREQAREHQLNGRFDDYWASMEKVKSEYIQHAKKQRFSREQALALVASTFGETADFLRKEGRHSEALRHYLYFLAHSGNGSATQMKRLPAFMKRAGISSDRISSAMSAMEKTAGVDGFDAIDNFLASN